MIYLVSAECRREVRRLRRSSSLVKRMAGEPSRELQRAHLDSPLHWIGTDMRRLEGVEAVGSTASGWGMVEGGG